MGKTVIVSAVRTPIGRFGGALKEFSASDLGGIAIQEALKQVNHPLENIDDVIMGSVLQGGQGQLPSRQALRKAGLPWETRSETINKVCASGMRSVMLSDLLIRSGESKRVVAGGMESMSNTPFYQTSLRWGNKMGNAEIKDGVLFDGLTCSFTGVHMGTYGNNVARIEELSREQQDEWALRSHELAIKAIKEGKFKDEIVSIESVSKKGVVTKIDVDECPREDTSIERLAKLSPAFDRDGTITAGNAPGINDGAAALLLMSEEEASLNGFKPIATILATESIAVEAQDFPRTPGYVIQKLLQKTNKQVSDISLFEINEAFAAVALASAKIAEIPLEKINVNGGAIALGHPIGASGARIIVSLIHALKAQGGGLGIAAICSGGGQGDAVLIEV
ncbi:acetyl-CoA C-acetyltransferase [Bacillus sp. EAC]|uniref:acetyl-CoA C-acetyltransferase n=1 Tax=Bacillus sp. EAC TaxID=1978338 RepID=UPI000B444E93|nr:acetyl-CoA C-acetyltransferase [Bacillus sp. EAC]